MDEHGGWSSRAGEAREWLDLVLEKALELRSVGVLSIGFDGRTVALAPPDPPEPDIDREDDEDEPPIVRRPYGDS